MTMRTTPRRLRPGQSPTPRSCAAPKQSTPRGFPTCWRSMRSASTRETCGRRFAVSSSTRRSNIDCTLHWLPPAPRSARSTRCADGLLPQVARLRRTCGTNSSQRCPGRARLALKQPGLRIGVVIEDLAQRRDELVLLADELLCPQFALYERPSRSRPYELSLGNPLGEVPLVMAAMGLISLREATLPAGEAAAILRSPYLSGADDAWMRHAVIERDWLDLGQREVALDDVVAAAKRRAPELAARWQAARAESPTHAAATPREWADAWRRWLAACGWPGVPTLDSSEHQARVAWECAARGIRAPWHGHAATQARRCAAQLARHGAGARVPARRDRRTHSVARRPGRLGA